MAMAYAEHPFGVLPSGEQVSRFDLENGAGTRVSVINYGCVITSVQTADRNGTSDEITLAFDSLDDFLAGAPYYGALIGRVANRISGGGFSLDGQFYNVASNQRGILHLHGGNKGFDKRVYEATPFKDNSNVGVRFFRVSPDGEEGYPGNLSLTHTVTLTDDNRLILDYDATTDARTLVNLTNHTYWNLSSDKTILDHELYLNAGEVAAAENALPSGEFVTLQPGDALDFSEWKTIGKDVDNVVGNSGYDHSYRVRGAGTELEATGDVVHAASVRSAASGRKMDIYTTSPDAHFYSGNNLTGQRGRDGSSLSGREALCIECEFFPDAPNNPTFPSIVLDPGARYRQRTEYRFSTY